MIMTPCTHCKHEIPDDSTMCPYCGKPNPVRQGSGFEWKSTTEVLGYPFIHIAFGKDANGRRRVARGVIAIGQFGIGLICIAQLGVGFLFGLGQLMVGFTDVQILEPPL